MAPSRPSNKWISQQIAKKYKNKHGNVKRVKHPFVGVYFYSVDSKYKRYARKARTRKMRKKIQRNISSDCQDLLHEPQQNYIKAISHMNKTKNRKSNSLNGPRSSLKITVRYWFESDMTTIKIPGPTQNKWNFVIHTRDITRQNIHQGLLEHIQLQLWDSDILLNDFKLQPCKWEKNITDLDLVDYRKFERLKKFWVNDYKDNLMKISTQCFNAVAQNYKDADMRIHWNQRNKYVINTDHLGAKMQLNDNEFVAEYNMRIFISYYTNHIFDGISGLMLLMLKYLHKQMVCCLEINGSLPGLDMETFVTDIARPSYIRRFPQLKDGAIAVDLHNTGKLVEVNEWQCSYYGHHGDYTYDWRGERVVRFHRESCRPFRVLKSN